MAQWVLAVQAEESELRFTDPQNVSSVAVHTCNRSAGGIEQADLELHWPTNQAETVSSRFGERPYLNKECVIRRHLN